MDRFADARDDEFFFRSARMARNRTTERQERRRGKRGGKRECRKLLRDGKAKERGDNYDFEDDFNDMRIEIAASDKTDTQVRAEHDRE